MRRALLVLVAIALAGLLLDVLSTHRNVGRYGLESEGNSALRASMDRNGLVPALAWYGATRAVALALLLAIPWALFRVARRWLIPEGEADLIRRSVFAIQALSAALCALVWWGQGWRTYCGLSRKVEIEGIMAVVVPEVIGSGD